MFQCACDGAIVWCGVLYLPFQVFWDSVKQDCHCDLEVVLLLTNECIIQLRELEPFVCFHLEFNLQSI